MSVTWRQVRCLFHDNTQRMNLPELIALMEQTLEEYGDMHNDDCGVNSDESYPDECECENMRWAKMRCREWMQKVDEMWVEHLQAHRKHCTPMGRKDLTLTNAIIHNRPLDKRS